MVAYRLNRIEHIDGTIYGKLVGEYDARIKRNKELEKERSTDDGFPNPRVMKQFGLGNALLSVVHRYVRDNALSNTKAAMLLGTKPIKVEQTLKHFEDKSGFFGFKVKA